MYSEQSKQMELTVLACSFPSLLPAELSTNVSSELIQPFDWFLFCPSGCFQLCNVFRQNMEIDQCLLESLPIGQRQRLVRRMRCDQIRAYYEREKSLRRQQGGIGARAPPAARRKKRRVRFSHADGMRDAVVRRDDKEGGCTDVGVRGWVKR